MPLPVRCSRFFSATRRCRTSSRSSAWMNFPEEDKLTFRARRKIERFLSQPFFVAEVFTGSPGKLVDLADTIKGFKGLCDGKYDHLPEAAFYMVGTIEEAVEKGRSSRRKRREAPRFRPEEPARGASRRTGGGIGLRPSGARSRSSG